MIQRIPDMKRYPLSMSELKRISNKDYIFGKRIRRNNRMEIANTFLTNFCNSSSIHGLKFIGDENTKSFEKKFWILVVLTSFMSIWFSIYFLDFSYTSELQTIVENTTFSISDITYPGVTICPTNRLDLTKFQIAQNKFLGNNVTDNTKKLFRQFMLKFEVFRWDRFEIFNEFPNGSLTILNNINLKNILDFMTISCEDLFVSCTWVNEPINCCAVFTKRITEIGFCYTFNAILTGKDRERAKTELNWPWRASIGGVNNGLFVKLRIDQSKRSTNIYSESDGVVIRLHDPEDSPRSTVFIAKGVDQLLSIEPIFLETVEEAKSVPSPVRQCLFDDEKYDPLYFVLPGLKYTYTNCQRQCRNKHTLLFCNCTLDMFYPLGDSRPCIASDFHCLAAHDEILSRSKKFEHDLGVGMVCYCLQNCKTVQYYVTPRTIETFNDTNNFITIDTYFLLDSLFKYRTYLARNWFDFLVYYGGVASFFLGCSLLSFVEIIYYFTIRLMVYVHENNNKNILKGNLNKIYSDQINQQNNKGKLLSRH